MISNPLKEYISERYPAYSHLADEYAKSCQKSGVRMARYPHGFFTWKAQGDALLILDLFTNKDYRAKGYAWALFHDIKTLAKALNLNVIIGFSEHTGPNQHLGQEAMKAAGFTMAYDTLEQSIWLRGVQ